MAAGILFVCVSGGLSCFSTGEAEFDAALPSNVGFEPGRESDPLAGSAKKAITHSSDRHDVLTITLA